MAQTKKFVNRFLKERKTDPFRTGKTKLANLFDQETKAFIATSINATLYVILSWTVVSPWALCLWWAAIQGVTLRRFFYQKKWSRNKECISNIEQIRQWENHFCTGVLYSGVLWGIAAALFLNPAQLAHFMLTAFLISGMSAGAIISYCYSRRAQLHFLIPTLIPFAIRIFISTEQLYHLPGFLVLLFTTLLIKLGQQIHTQVCRAVEVSHENNDLLESVAAKNKELTDANEDLIDLQLELDGAAKARAEFLAVMTHEIRTPLNGIIGMSQLLQNAGPEDDKKEMIGTIASSGNILLHLVNNILDFSKIDADQIDLEHSPFDLQKCAKDAANIVKPNALKKGLEVKLELDPKIPSVIMGDPARLQQVILNFSNNAIKFTDKGHVSIIGEIMTQTANEYVIQITVEDTGIGIPEDKIDKLFKKFSQVDSSTTRKYGGTGLGLAICKGLIEKMGGKVWVESTPGKGSRFCLSFHTVSAEGKTPVNAEQPVKLDAKKSDVPLDVLVVEDNPVNQQVAMKYLKRLGYKAECADDGLIGFKKVCEKKYDLVLMDMMMPNMNGLEATKKIRAEVPDSHQPHIAVLTASAMSEEKEITLKAGANDYVSKPITLTRLSEIVAKVAEDKQPTKSTLAVDPPPDNVVPFKKPKKTLDESVLSELRALTEDGEDDFLTSMIGEFLQLAKAKLPELGKAIESKDFVSIQKLAHLMKGSSHNMGAVNMVTLCKKLEQRGKDKSDEGIEEAGKNLIAEFEIVERELNENWTKAA